MCSETSPLIIYTVAQLVPSETLMYIYCRLHLEESLGPILHKPLHCQGEYLCFQACSQMKLSAYTDLLAVTNSLLM